MYQSCNLENDVRHTTTLSNHSITRPWGLMPYEVLFIRLTASDILISHPWAMRHLIYTKR